MTTKFYVARPMTRKSLTAVRRMMPDLLMIIRSLASVTSLIAISGPVLSVICIEYCHYGVAMGSGGPEIKAMADFITTDVDKDGMWNAFVHLGLV